MLVRAVRLRLLLPGSLSLWQAVTINAYGDAASAVTPGRLGGDPARFFGSWRSGVGTSRAVAGLGVEAVIDWVLLSVAAIVLGLAFADTAAAGARHLLALATGPTARWLVAAALLLTAASAAAAHRYRHRIPVRIGTSLAAAWQQARQLGWLTVALAATLTALSMTLRTAILPVLVPGHPGSIMLGSFVLLYAQLLLPTPAGAGGVELGFVGGFAGTLSAGALATLLVTWRLYTLILPAALGAVLFAGAARAWYSASSSAKARSQP